MIDCNAVISRVRPARLAWALALMAAPLAPSLHSGTSLPTLAVAAAQARESASIPEIVVETGLGTVTLKDIALSNSSLTGAEFKALFTAAALDSLADKLATWDADKVAIGSITTVFKKEAMAATQVYQNVEATGIKGGTIANLKAAGATISQTLEPGKPGEMKGTMGPTTIDALDIGHMIRWITAADTSGKAEFKPINGPYSIAYYDLAFPDGKMRIEQISLSSARAKLMPAPLTGMLALSLEMEASKAQGGEPDPKTVAKLFAFLEGMMNSIEYGEGSIGKIEFSGKSKSDNKSFTAATGKISFRGDAKTAMAIDGMTIEADDGKVGVRKVASSGAFIPMMTAMMRSILPKEATAELPPAAPIGDFTFTMDGLDIDVPDDKKKDKAGKPQRIKMSIEQVESVSAQFVGPTPGRVGFSLKHFKMPIPADTKDDGMKQLLDLGIQAIDLSSRVSGAWTEASATYAIEDISVELEKLARVSLTGNLGNISRAMFDGAPEARMLAALAGNIQNAKVTLVDFGLGDKLIGKLAKDQKKTPAQMKNELSFAGPMVVASVMGDHPDARGVSEALGNYLKNFGTLVLEAKAAEPTGLTAADFAAAANPIDLLKKVRFTANASK